MAKQGEGSAATAANAEHLRATASASNASKAQEQHKTTEAAATKSERKAGRKGRERGTETEHARRQYGEEIERAARSRRSRNPGVEEQRRRSRSTREAEHRRPEPFKSTRRSPSAAAPQFCFLRVCRTASEKAQNQAVFRRGADRRRAAPAQARHLSGVGGALTFSATRQVFRRHTVPHTTHHFQIFQILYSATSPRPCHTRKPVTTHIYYCDFSKIAPTSDFLSNCRRLLLPLSVDKQIK